MFLFDQFVTMSKDAGISLKQKLEILEALKTMRCCDSIQMYSEHYVKNQDMCEKTVQLIETIYSFEYKLQSDLNDHL